MHLPPGLSESARDAMDQEKTAGGEVLGALARTNARLPTDRASPPLFNDLPATHSVNGPNANSFLTREAITSGIGSAAWNCGSEAYSCATRRAHRSARVSLEPDGLVTSPRTSLSYTKPPPWINPTDGFNNEDHDM